MMALTMSPNRHFLITTGLVLALSCLALNKVVAESGDAKSNRQLRPRMCVGTQQIKCPDGQRNLFCHNKNEQLCLSQLEALGYTRDYPEDYCGPCSEGGLVILSFALQNKNGTLNSAIFTTDPTENAVYLTTFAPASVSDSQLLYKVREVNENWQVDTSKSTGRSVTLRLTHTPLVSLTNPRYSAMLEFEISAYTTSGLYSDITRIKQDIKSQIRQEFADKRAFTSSFTLAMPSRDDIITPDQYNQQPGENFIYTEYAGDSDPSFANKYVIIKQSRTICNKVRTAWNKPVIVYRGWLNPRAMDAFNVTDVNSRLQTGDAVRINPSSNSANWPTSVSYCLGGGAINTYSKAQQALACVAQANLDSATYVVSYDGSSVYIKPVA